jgi:hypothetical protein
MATNPALPHVPDASDARRVKFEVSDMQSTPTWTELGGVQDIKFGGLTRDKIETTNVQSPQGYKEYIGGLKDGGEISLTIEFNPSEPTHANQTNGLLAIFEENTPHNFRVVWPDASRTIWAFAGIIVKMPPQATMNKAITADVGVQVSGPMTYGTGGT